MKRNHIHTKGVSGSKIFSSRASFSSLASDKRSADGELSVCKEWDNLDSVGTLFGSARGVEGMLVDFIPLDLSLVFVKVPKPLSRFWSKVVNEKL